MIGVVTNDHPEIRAASEAARAELPRLYDTFQQGLAPGESFLVKGPFEGPGGTQEWMWVEVVEWSDGRIRGLLMNEPRFAEGVEHGSSVTMKEADVFDYIFVHSDGSEEGNQTAAAIERHSVENQ
ncbi:MAG TPA: DUF2314 domain-containing protein [Thermoanaerobaculia bacterium]|jgi:uncharacterized protein YegJ (DUF2314 family)